MGQSGLWRTLGLLLVGTALSLWLFYPGCTVGDILYTWGDAQRGQVTDFQPPLLAILYRLFSAFPLQPDPPTASLFLLSTLVYWSGLLLVVQSFGGQGLYGLAGLVILGFFLPTFGILSQILSDTLMSSFLVLAYGCLAWGEARGRPAGVIAGIISLGFASLCKATGVIAALPLALWAGRLLASHLHGWQPGGPRRLSALGLSLVVALGLVGGTWGVNRLLTQEPTYPSQQLLAFDLTGISAITGTVYLPDVFTDTQTPHRLPGFYVPKGRQLQTNPLMIQNLRTLYEPHSSQKLYFYGPGKGLPFLDRPAEMQALRRAWLKGVTQAFPAYIQVRARMAWALFAGRPWPPYYCLPNDNLVSGDVLNRALPQVFVWLAATPLLQGWFYGLAILGLLLISRGRPALQTGRYLSLGWSGLAYGVSLFFLAATAEFRHLYWLMFVTLLMGFEVLRLSTSPAMEAENRQEPP
ncbi:MAG: hypothetical protein IGQ88_08960 [Gloeomargaritaceae cyanobacterium C42_A2020_066]|nr:hypothetical protein [Gloeomargaritaceae cyanobacterium C42_A2020_066]